MSFEELDVYGSARRARARARVRRRLERLGWILVVAIAYAVGVYVGRGLAKPETVRLGHARYVRKPEVGRLVFEGIAAEEGKPR